MNTLTSELIKVTICELSETRDEFLADWSALEKYIANERPRLLLLPEMPFGKWLAADRIVSETLKMESIEQHKKWINELEKLEADYIVYSTPEYFGNRFLNTAFVYSKLNGHQRLHSKAYFPEEPHFWEESWFDKPDPVVFNSFFLDGFSIGVLLCTELWFTEHGRKYGEQGIDLLLCPRATGEGSIEQWLNCGRTLAIISGSYCLSSNRSGKGDKGFQWGGAGWIAAPMNGALLATSSKDNKFVSVTIDLHKSRLAKKEYPLYVKSSEF
jgi:predicted amidohydrolase